jgi:pimeloyl-ACP methyl ester carboxylesterase
MAPEEVSMPNLKAIRSAEAGREGKAIVRGNPEELGPSGRRIREVSSRERVKDRRTNMTTHHRSEVQGQEVYYREAGPKEAPTIVLLHGFPSSSHMFRDLIPKLADRYHLIAPDYIGFGYSAHPNTKDFQYTFDNLAAVVQELLFQKLNLKNFSIYVQDYGAPIGFRIASQNPQAIDAIIVQNGNAYAEGLSVVWEPLRAMWATRTAETEKPVRAFLTAETTKFQYTQGVRDIRKVSPDSWTFDQFFLERPGNDAVQLELFYNYQSNLALYPDWQAYFRKHQPPTLIVWGRHDPFFTVEGAKSYLRDLPQTELHLLDTGHFALEEESDAIAERISGFLQIQRRSRKA